MLIISQSLAEQITINELSNFRNQVLYLIMNTKLSPEDMLAHCEALHRVTQVLRLYGQ